MSNHPLSQCELEEQVMGRKQWLATRVEGLANYTALDVAKLDVKHNGI